MRRVWAYCVKFQAGNRTETGETLRKATRFEIHSVLRQINYDIDKQQFNTVASGAMKILNALERLQGLPKEAEEGLRILLKALSPITPHIAHHLWRELKFGEDIMLESWPEPDREALEQDEVELVVQVNGKLRGSIRVPKAADKEAIQVLAVANANVQKFISGQTIKKIVVVPGRLVNLVV